MNTAATLDAFVGEVTTLESLGCNWMSYVPAHLGPISEDVAPHQGLLLLLAIGPTFGDTTPFLDPTLKDPFDSRALLLLEPLLSLLRSTWDSRARTVYPAPETKLSLMKWLEAARLHHPSRLGIGIRPDCGTWFAVRAAVSTQVPGAARAYLESRYPPLESPAQSPCEQCLDAPCVTTCPAAAVSETLDLNRCMTQRLEPNSPCASRCSARLACPVGATHRYSDAQIAHHYGASLKMLRCWNAG